MALPEQYTLFIRQRQDFPASPVRRLPRAIDADCRNLEKSSETVVFCTRGNVQNVALAIRFSDRHAVAAEDTRRTLFR